MATADADPFGVAELRAATVAGWVSSPTRLVEDITAEEDLVTVGYRDRLFTELAANAADAAAAAGKPGGIAVWAVHGDVHVANTGVPLTEAGVRSLLALRVSAKNVGDAASVGRFGVGFTATAAVADRVEIRSATGSVVFDRAATADAVTAAGLDLDRRPPLLRLGWSSTAAPTTGFDTEIVLRLRADVAASDLLADALAEAGDLLLELPALTEIRIADTTVTGRRSPVDGADRVRIIDIDTDSPPGNTVRRFLESCVGGTRWIVETDERGRPVVGDVQPLCAPTPTDIELSLPARCVTDLPLTPDRRHLHPDADITTTAAGYMDLVRAVPAASRPVLIPTAVHTRNRDDASLIDRVLDELRTGAWLPNVSGDADLVPERAVMLPDATEDLGAALAPVVGDLTLPAASERRRVPALRSVGVTEIGLAGLAERLVGVDREPSWWRDLYAALSPLVTTAQDAEELGALPIPRSDGRMNIGARGLFTADRIDVPITWIPTVHRDARHPLLERLGAEAISVEQALADPALAELVDTVDEADAQALTDEVCTVIASDPEATIPAWLAALLLPDTAGELRPADELLLADSPLASVLVDDSPFGVVAAEIEQRFGAEVLRRLGVGWGFLTVHDELPVAADHDLPDEEQWWDSRAEPPESLTAVRDLDLVDVDRWPQALTLLATDDVTAPLLADRDGYTAWWLRHHAVVDGQPLGWYRAPSDTSVEGVRDPLDHPHADALAAALGGLDVESADDADVLLAHLGDPEREMTPGVAASVHSAVVAAVRRGVFDPADLAVPERLRVASGQVAERAVVLDRPWLVQIVEPAELVTMTPPIVATDAQRLAEVLDVPTADDEFEVAVCEPGDPSTAASAEAILFAAEWSVVPRHGEVRLHHELWVTVSRNGTQRDVSVAWWVDDRGVTHLRRRSSPLGTDTTDAARYGE